MYTLETPSDQPGKCLYMEFKISDDGSVFGNTRRTSGGREKRRIGLDSGRQIGVTPTQNEVVRAREGVCGSRFVK
jgi:hypothetical protein